MQRQNRIFDWRRITADWILTIVFALLIGWIIRMLFIQPVSISDTSMKPNLQPGDKVLGLRYRFSEPELEDAVVFHHPLKPELLTVKRIAALGGDTVAVEGGVFIRNNNPMEAEEDSLMGETFTGFLDPRKKLSPFIIFAKGDTLDLSQLELRNFSYAVNLIQQENPEFQLKQKAELYVDGNRQPFDLIAEKTQMNLDSRGL